MRLLDKDRDTQMKHLASEAATLGLTFELGGFPSFAFQTLPQQLLLLFQILLYETILAHFFTNLCRRNGKGSRERNQLQESVNIPQNKGLHLLAGPKNNTQLLLQ